MMFLITACIGFATVSGQGNASRSRLQGKISSDKYWIAIQLDNDNYYYCNYGGSDLESVAKKCISLSGKSSGTIIVPSGTSMDGVLKKMFSSAGSGAISGTNAYRF